MTAKETRSTYTHIHTDTHTERERERRTMLAGGGSVQTLQRNADRLRDESAHR